MEYFVGKNSIVREIWGKADVIIFIFAGAAAEFALNKAVDWLFFTGKLPADPLNRLFSTVAYAQKIVFSPKNAALATIDQMTSIHSHVEDARGKEIPEWAYRDVLFLLIDYSIRSYQLLERKLTEQEKEEVFQVFHTLGVRMNIKNLPITFNTWKIMRKEHLKENLENSDFTKKLFFQYRKHLGLIRYKLLQEAQILVVPEEVRNKLTYRRYSLLKPTVPIYRLLYKLKMDRYLKSILFPAEYKEQIQALEKTA
jgi:hypothetical protein